MRPTWPTHAPDGLTAGYATTRPDRPISRAGGAALSRFASMALDHLPFVVAVLDSATRLHYWNDNAAMLFGMPALMAAEHPRLDSVLAGIPRLTVSQRDNLMTFVRAGLAERDSAATCLRFSLGRQHRLAFQIRTLDRRHWMLVASDASMAEPGGIAGTGDAMLDTLTGLGNRRQLLSALSDDALSDNALSDNAPSADGAHALLLIDVDRFAAINESHGHAVGDALLCVIAQRLRRTARDDDLLARTGGDEMAVLMRNGDQAEVLAARLADALSRPYSVEGKTIRVGVSVGIARFPDHGRSADELLHHADLALGEAKSAGGRTWREFGPDVAARVAARRALDTELRQALTLGELSLCYLPRRALPDRTVIGLEAVPFWNHPVRGTIEPDEFAVIAGDSGCISELGAWVIRTACLQAATWPAPLTVAVNVTARQLEPGAHLVEAIQAALRASGLASERLEIQISGPLPPANDTRAILSRLHAIGVAIVIDGFGSGSASLDQLRDLPAGKIKIDSRLIAELGDTRAAAASVQAIATLGRRFGVATIAAGAEAERQVELFAANGCAAIQCTGPIPEPDVGAFLAGLAMQQDSK